MADLNRKSIVALMTEFEKAVAAVEVADGKVLDAEAVVAKTRSVQADAVSAAKELQTEIEARVSALLPDARVRTSK